MGKGQCFHYHSWNFNVLNIIIKSDYYSLLTDVFTLRKDEVKHCI